MPPPDNDDTSSPAHPDDPAGHRKALWSGMDQGSIMSVELLGAILTWTAIGWLIDGWLGTMPWFLAGGALLGNAAGLYLIWLRSGREDARQRAHREQAAAGHAAVRELRRQGGDDRGSR